jgi:hypothetical protein
MLLSTQHAGIMQLVTCAVIRCCSVHSTLVLYSYMCRNTMLLSTQHAGIMQLVTCAVICCSVHSMLVLYSYVCRNTMLLSTQHAGIMQLVIYNSGSMEVLFGPQYYAVCFLNSSSVMRISSRTLLWMPPRRWRSQMARVAFCTQWEQWTFWKLMAVAQGRVCL